MSDSPTSPQAVFLSYAREDTDAARRIAEALRGFGVEVWFDQSELRGGDSWDQKIRQQIKECALFAPVISAHTEARGEGYFRLEWKLADERTHLMAKGLPFLLPIVVDATADGEAMVPDSFRAVQWTRLHAGAPTSQFVEQVKRLLAAPRKSSAGKKSDSAAAPALSLSNGPASAAPAAKPGLPFWAKAAIVAGGLGLVAVVVLRPTMKEISAVAATKSGAEPKATVIASPVNEKSLAVLPFENLSPDKENEFFTSGIHEEILAALQTVQELRVIQYRGANKTMRQVGEELKVAYALECSVRRAGTKVRVTGKLTNTRTEEQKWAETFEGDLTDVFAIQSSLAKTIAAKLSAELSPVEKTTIERRSTTSVAAYDLYLKARDIRYRSANTQDATSQTEALLLQAVKLDPQFALAWGEIAFTHGFRYSDNQDRSESRLAQARAALETMKRLAPGDPETLRQEGNFYYFTTRDYPRAMDLFTQALALRPNDPESYYSLCQVLRRQGKWAECMDNFRKAIALDPQNDRLLRNAAYTLSFARHYHGLSSRLRSQRQSGENGSKTHTGSPSAAARCATDVSTAITRSSCEMSAAESEKSAICAVGSVHCACAASVDASVSLGPTCRLTNSQPAVSNTRRNKSNAIERLAPPFLFGKSQVGDLDFFFCGRRAFESASPHRDSVLAERDVARPRLAKAMNLDTSLRYFTTETDAMILHLPENCAPAVLAEIGGYLKPKFAEAVDAGINKVVLDVHHVRTLHMGIIKLLFQAMQTCRELAIQFALVGHAQIVSECKGFEDTRGWTFHESVADAKASFNRSPNAAPQLAAVG